MDDSESTDDNLHHQNGGLQYTGVNDRLENHLGSDRSHRRREIEPPFARNLSKYPSQSFEMESDSFDRSVKNRAHCGGKVRHSLHVDRDQYANSKVSIVHSNLSYQFKPDATFH